MPDTTDNDLNAGLLTKGSEASNNEAIFSLQNFWGAFNKFLNPEDDESLEGDASSDEDDESLEGDASSDDEEALVAPAPAPVTAATVPTSNSAPAPDGGCSKRRHVRWADLVKGQQPTSSSANAGGASSVLEQLEEGLLGRQITEENTPAANVPTSTSAPTSDSADDSAPAADYSVVTQQPGARDAGYHAMEEGWYFRSFSLGSFWWLYRPNAEGDAPDTFATQFIGLGLVLNCVTFLFLPLIVIIGLKMTDHDHDSRSVDSSYGTLAGYSFLCNMVFFGVCCMCAPWGLCSDRSATRRRVSQCENHTPYTYCTVTGCNMITSSFFLTLCFSAWGLDKKTNASLESAGASLLIPLALVVTGVCLHNSEIFLRSCQGRERENRSNGDGQIAAM